MMTSPAFRGKRYAVLGLARSGLATVRALVASGAKVVAWDSNETARNAVGSGVTFADPLEIDLAEFDGVVVSPGVPLNCHPIASYADDAAVPIIGDIELFAEIRPYLPTHKVVGITGTNGKSTTTALIHHIIKTAGIPTMMGGNIGLPILGQDPLPPGGIYVLELSSYQIDLTYSLDCDVAVLLNISPDHLDRYDGFDDYRASKIRLLEMQSPECTAVIASGENGIEADVMALDVGADTNFWFHGSYETDFAEEQISWPSLQGPHNAQNAWAARMTCLSLGLSRDQIDAGLKSYPGLPHRMERVRTLNDVLYVNDSKGTNAAATAPALAAYPLIHWILGGVAKTDHLHECAPYLKHVRAAYVIGEAAPVFAALLKPHMVVHESGTLDVAMAQAHAAAKAGDTVLLSPACASFDQFKDFEARGDAFRALVEALV